jgi:isopentenyl phosphate kinase
MKLKINVVFALILMFGVVFETNKTSEAKTIEIASEKNFYYEDVYDTLYQNIIGTVYHPVVSQCDSDPLITADLSKIDTTKTNELRWIALSRDLINQQDKWRKWFGKICFGDTVIIQSPYPEINGEWVVHDTMNKRYKNRLDFLQDVNGVYGKWENIKIIRKYTKKVYI